MKTRLALLVAVSTFGAVGILAACNGEILDLGGNADGSSSANPSDGGSTVPSDATIVSPAEDAVAPPRNPTTPPDEDGPSDDDDFPLDAPATLDLPLVPAHDAGDPTAGDQETWTGYVESYTFPRSKSDVVKLTFTELGDGGITGHAVFGSLPLFPPVTDPNVGYPYADSSADGLTAVDITTVEGFAFTLYNGSLSANRLQAGVDPREFQAQWCTYQTPYLQQAGSDIYSCLPNGSASGGSSTQCDLTLAVYGRTYPVNCNRWTFCGGLRICDCDGSACGSSVDPARQDTKFDLQVNGTHADGSVTLAPNTPTNLHLVKQ